jgi:6-phosphogluconolactonase
MRGTMPALPTIHCHSDAEALARAVAERWVVLAQDAIAARGVFHVALAGGNTPRRLYQLLAGDEFRVRAQFDRAQLWLGDERCVPAGHPDSNYRMAREAFADALPTGRLWRVETERGAEEAASHYARLLREHLPTVQDLPRFDLVLLGMGPDGHTASLFPGTNILSEHLRTVAPVYVEKFASWRVSLTLPVLNQSRHVLFMVAGADKAEALHRVLIGRDAALPSASVKPQGGAEWHLDATAAARLTE